LTEIRFPIRIEITVLWGDMDALGHVNNAIYARWLEQARIEYFRSLGAFGVDGSGPILARQAIDFKSPVTYPDRITIEIGVERIGTTSLVLRSRGTSEAQGGVLVFQGESIIVLFDYGAGHKVAIDDKMRERIEAFQSASE
jgi:acyl-CoA thioester hydrolase